MKKVITILCLLLFSSGVFAAPGTIVTYTIDPVKNAQDHNNKGIMYVEEKCYYAAIQEFKIAISLNPKTQATAVYFNNLGKVYMTIGYPQLALDCFENALTQYNMNLEYFQNLAQCYAKLGMTQTRLQEYKAASKDNPVSKVMVAILENQLGHKKRAVIILDEFVNSEPNLLITPAIRQYIKDLVDEINR